MTRWIAALGLVFASQAMALAHFVFVVPQKDGTFQVVLSETLEADDAVTVEKIAGLKLTAIMADGKEDPLALEAGKHFLSGKLGSSKPRIAFGSMQYAVMKRGEGKPFLLEYIPKAVWPGVDEAGATIGKTAALEIVPIIRNGKAVLRVLAAGEAVADAEVTIVKADGTKATAKAAADGCTQPLELKGANGVWVKITRAKAGELASEKYKEIRSYATVTFTMPDSAIPPLVKGVSSHGAAACDGYVYVYGGHSGERHVYDSTTALGTFQRLKLDGGTTWESLPGGPGLQGLALVAHTGAIIRVGGMTPRNAPGEDANLISTAECSRYDIAAKAWAKLPDLPAPRSSHDAWVIGDKLYVVGGWQMNGKDGKSTWSDTALELDLAAKTPEWKSLKQPFQRRALTCAALGTKLYVIGGLDADGHTQQKLDIYDAATGQWSSGPELPGKGSGFSPAATATASRLFVSTNDGGLLALSMDGKVWDSLGKSQSARMVHRIVWNQDKLLLIGGAGRDGNFQEIETVTVK